MEPLVSIIIPTYNYAVFIKEAIASILQQDYPKNKIEIIVVDDGSIDNTKDVLQDLINDNTIMYYYQHNEGKASATYKAIQLANGKYIFNLDADDYFLPGKLQKTVAVFEGNDNIVHVANPAKQIMPDDSFRIEPVPPDIMNKPLNGSLLLRHFMYNNMLYGGGSTYAARASVLKEIVVPAGVDMYTDEFLILAILPFGESYFINEPLSVWRGHGSNYSLNASTNNLQISKAKRLLKSSDALLNYLATYKFEKDLINIYRLKNLNSHLAFKEFTNTKSFKDIFRYAKQVFFSIRPDRHLIKQYQVLNRLIPTSLFKLMKSVLKRNTNKGLQVVQ